MEFIYRNTTANIVGDAIRMNITENSTPGKLSRKLFPTDGLYGGVTGNSIWLKKSSWYYRGIPQRHFEGSLKEIDGDVILSGSFRHSLYSIVGSILIILAMCILCAWLAFDRYGTICMALSSRLFKIQCSIITIGTLMLLASSSRFYWKEEQYVKSFLEESLLQYL